MYAARGYVHKCVDAVIIMNASKRAEICHSNRASGRAGQKRKGQLPYSLISSERVSSLSEN